MLIVLYILIGVNLIKQIQSNYDDQTSDGKQAPGVKQIISIIVIMCLFMFLRMVFVSLPDIAKIHRIDSISKNTQYWPVVFGLIATTNIFATLAVFLSIYLIYKSEREIAESPERLGLVNN